MSQVRGTPEGRIFLAGANGHLYELQYQSYLSWFGKRCKLVNQSSSYFSFLVPSALRFLFTLSPLPSGFYFICALRPQVFIFFVPSALRFLFYLCPPPSGFYFLCPLRPQVFISSSPPPSGFYFLCPLRPQVFIFFVPSALRFYFLCPLALRPKVLFLRQICNCPGHTVSDKH